MVKLIKLLLIVTGIFALAGGFSGCLSGGKLVRFDAEPVELSASPLVEACAVWDPFEEEQAVPANCVLLLEHDLDILIVEYMRACIAAGGKPSDCTVSVRESE